MISKASSRLAAGLMLASSLLTTGCYKATFIDSNAHRGAEHEEWTDFFVFGLVGTEEYDVRKFCQGPVALVRTGGNFATGLVSLVTLGIYFPRKVYVTCAAGPGPTLVPGIAPSAPAPAAPPPASLPPASAPPAAPGTQPAPAAPMNPAPTPPAPAAPAAVPESAQLSLELDDAGNPVKLHGALEGVPVVGQVAAVEGMPGAYRVRLQPEVAR